MMTIIDYLVIYTKHFISCSKTSTDSDIMETWYNTDCFGVIIESLLMSMCNNTIKMDSISTDFTDQFPSPILWIMLLTTNILCS